MSNANSTGRGFNLTKAIILKKKDNLELGKELWWKYYLIALTGTKQDEFLFKLY